MQPNQSEGHPERDILSLCVMGWGLAPAENSSAAAAVAAAAVAAVALPDGALYILYIVYFYYVYTLYTYWCCRRALL